MASKFSVRAGKRGTDKWETDKRVAHKLGADKRGIGQKQTLAETNP